MHPEMYEVGCLDFAAWAMSRWWHTLDCCWFASAFCQVQQLHCDPVDMPGILASYNHCQLVQMYTVIMTNSKHVTIYPCSASSLITLVWWKKTPADWYLVPCRRVLVKLIGIFNFCGSYDLLSFSHLATGTYPWPHSHTLFLYGPF